MSSESIETPAKYTVIEIVEKEGEKTTSRVLAERSSPVSESMVSKLSRPQTIKDQYQILFRETELDTNIYIPKLTAEYCRQLPGGQFIASDNRMVYVAEIFTTCFGTRLHNKTAIPSIEFSNAKHVDKIISIRDFGIRRDVGGINTFKTALRELSNAARKAKFFIQKDELPTGSDWE